MRSWSSVGLVALSFGSGCCPSTSYLPDKGIRMQVPRGLRPVHVLSPTCCIASGGRDCRLTRNRYQTVDDTPRISAASHCSVNPSPPSPPSPETRCRNLGAQRRTAFHSWEIVCSWNMWARPGEIRDRRAFLGLAEHGPETPEGLPGITPDDGTTGIRSPSWRESPPAPAVPLQASIGAQKMEIN